MSSRSAPLQRLFVALFPPPDVRQRVNGLANGYADSTGGIAVPDRNLHVTLKFLGQVGVDVQREIESSLGEIRAPVFRLNFDKVEFRPRQRMVWLLPAACAALEDLTAVIEERVVECGLPANNHPYRPHITLTRKTGPLELNSPLMVEPIGWECDQFSLVASETLPTGSRYTRLRDWELLK